MVMAVSLPQSRKALLLMLVTPSLMVTVASLRWPLQKSFIIVFIEPVMVSVFSVMFSSLQPKGRFSDTSERPTVAVATGM